MTTKTLGTILLVLQVVAVCIIIFTIPFLIYHPLSNDTEEEIVVADAQYQSFGLFYIALENKYFEEQKLKVKVRHFDLGKDALDDAIAGNSDLATVYAVPFVRQVLLGKQISIVSSLHNSDKGTGIIANKLNGVSKVEDLQGKKVGVVKGTNSEIFLYSMLERYNIEKNKVVVVFDTPENLEKKFLRNELDAVSIFNPFVYNILIQVPKENLTEFYSPENLDNSVLAGNTENLINKKEQVTRLLKALVKAEKYSKDNKQGSIEKISRHLPEVGTKTIANLWDSYTLTVKLDNVLLEHLNKEAQILTNNEDLSNNGIDFRDHILTEYLKKVSPEDVTISK